VAAKKLNMVLGEKMNQTVFLVKYIINEMLKVCYSTLLTVHCGINNSVSKEQFEDVNRQYRDVCFSFSPPRYDLYW
jgi:hypothetical protein